VWKRASIATEFDVDIGGIPRFLVDTATREGMSGSPVILRSFGRYSTKTNAGVVAGQVLSQMGGGVYSQFVGVYSGRHIGQAAEAQRGIIWKDSLIREIIDAPAAGSHEFSKEHPKA